MLKILRHDLKVQALHLSHGVVTILFHCHPRELVIDEQAKINHMLIFMMSMFLLFLNRRYQSISLCCLYIQLVLVDWHGQFSCYSWCYR